MKNCPGLGNVGYYGTMCCLADPEQRIFDYRPNVNPLRVIAVLCRNNKFVATLSNVLQVQHTFKGKIFLPIEHGVVWDAELAVAAAVTVASIMEWSSGNAATLTKTLGLLSRYYQLKNAEKATKKAAEAAMKCTQTAKAVGSGLVIRSKALSQFRKNLAAGIGCVGEPMKDWVSARRVLQSATGFDDVFEYVSMGRLF